MEVWLFFCILLTGILCLADPCGNWFKKRRTCYMLSTCKLTWTESEKFCRDTESSLAMVKTRKQHDFLQKHIIANVSPNTTTVWVGARYNASLKEYRWLDGSMMNVSGWGKNQPDSTEGCVYYSYFQGWQWSGRRQCKRTVGQFICETHGKKSCNTTVDPCTVRQTGFYGPVCQYSCPEGCAGKTCNIYNGKCNNGCKKGLKGDFCKTCQDSSRYGSRCKSQCPQNCSTCINRRNCAACKDGFWGKTCNQPCDKTCLNDSCDFRMGNCSKRTSEQPNGKTMSSNESLEDVSRNNTKINNISSDVSFLAESSKKDMENAIAFRSSEIGLSWSQILMISSGATCLLTFAGVVGIACILCRRDTKTQGFWKERKGRNKKSKKLGTKWTKEQIVANVDDDSSSEHLQDWHRVSIDQLFSHYTDDKNRDTIVGTIYP